MMRILMIGGTGTISSAITRQLAESEHELWLLNRGNRQAELPEGVNQIVADVENEQLVAEKLGDMQFDAVFFNDEILLMGKRVILRFGWSEQQSVTLWTAKITDNIGIDGHLIIKPCQRTTLNKSWIIL